LTADTITIPDDEMLRLMATASVGDDVYKQDRATNDLQARIAKLAGKEAALFVVSGTMSNRRSCSLTSIWELSTFLVTSHAFFFACLYRYCPQNSLSEHTSPNPLIPSLSMLEHTFIAMKLVVSPSILKLQQCQ